MTARAEYDFAEEAVEPLTAGAQAGQMLALEIVAAYGIASNREVGAALLAIAAAGGYLMRSSEIAADRMASQPHVANGIAAALKAGRSYADLADTLTRGETDPQRN